MKFKEVEFKYRADNVSLKEFSQFCEKLKPETFLIASGYDYFYSPKAGDNFCRHRVGPDCNQLTFKSKTTNKNSFIRTEHNLGLDSSGTKEQVAALCAEFGYEYNTTIFKNAFIYKYATFILVYYICYDVDLKELGRFIEVEMDEAHPWGTETAAWDALCLVEKDLVPLGISPQSRMKRSLFEMFRNSYAQ